MELQLVRSTVAGRLGCFHSCTGKAATDSPVHVCWWTYTLTSTGFAPTGEISGSEWRIYLSLDKTANSFPKWLDHFPVPAGLFHLGHLCVCTHACVSGYLSVSQSWFPLYFCREWWCSVTLHVLPGHLETLLCKVLFQVSCSSFQT